MKNNGLTDGERLVSLEIKLDAVTENQAAMQADLKTLMKTVSELLPGYVTRTELGVYQENNEKRIENLKKANKLQAILTNILVSGLSVVMTALIMFWFNNK